MDDEPMLREVLARYFEWDGFRVGAVEDGEQAIEASRASREQGWLSAGIQTTGPRSCRGCGPIACEARNPELEGRKNFGVAISEVAHADRQNCPEE